MTFMTSKFVLDSFAWIEYFKGTKNGKKVKEVLENQSCFTPTIVIAELSDMYSKEHYSFWEKDLNFILENSIVLQLNTEIASIAGKLKQTVRKKYKNNFGLADRIILATARTLNANVVTGDHHFKPLKNIEFIG